MKQLLISLFLLTLFFSSGAQSNKNVVILINQMPTRVLLASNGTILETIEEIPNYLDKYGSFPENTHTYVDNALSNESSNEFSPSNASESILFSFMDSTLDSRERYKLENAYAFATANSRMISLTTSYNPSNAEAFDVATKRIKACKDELLSMGFTSNRILTSISESSKSSNEVLVSVK